MMSEEPGKETQAEELDEIDRFLSTLPSLHISEDMVEDIDFPPRTGKSGRQAPLTSILSLLAWAVLIFSLLTVYRAAPSEGTALWDGIVGKTSHYPGDPNLRFAAMCYLWGNCAVCLGGIGICAAKKMKLSRGIALSFWIAGGVSAAIAFILMRYM